MLTTKAIRALKPQETQYEIVDGHVPGLRLRISQDGTKTFTLLYRHRGKRRRIKLGRFPEIGLAEARQHAYSVLAEIRLGDDPRAKKETDALVLRSVKEFAEMFIAMHVERNNKPSTIEGTSRIIRKDIIEPWGDRDVRDISRADALDLIETITVDRSPFAASNVLRAGRTLFSWLVSRETLEASPFASMKDPAGTVRRERTLGSGEISAVWHATKNIGAPWDSIIRLLFLTGRRRGEVVGAGWEEFDWTNFIWTIPGDRTKGSRRSFKPITPFMCAELKRLGPADNGLIFRSRKKLSVNAVSGFSKMKRRLDQQCGVSDWRIHDIRRTVATNLGSLGVADTTIARILDHRMVGIPDVTSTYNRHRYIPEMREALEMWEESLRQIIDENTHLCSAM